MTPEVEIDEEHQCALCGVPLYLLDGSEWAEAPEDELCHDCALKEVVRCRAALRERDAEWVQAVRPNDDGRDDDGWLWCGNCDLPLDARTPEDVNECCKCDWSAPLRALLEEAAGSETAGSHGRDAGGQGAVSGWPAGAVSDSLAVSAFARLVELLLDEAQDVIKALAMQTGKQRLHNMAREAAKLCAVARNMQKAALLEEAGK